MISLRAVVKKVMPPEAVGEAEAEDKDEVRIVLVRTDPLTG